MKIFMQNILFAFASFGFHPSGFFSTSWKQNWAALNFIFCCLNSTRDCLVQSCRDRGWPCCCQSATSDGQSLSWVWALLPTLAACGDRPCLLRQCLQPGRERATLHPCVYLLPRTLGARWALGAVGSRRPALVRNGDDHSLGCLGGHGCYHESMQCSF